jgi:hypothetical protein
MNHFHQFREEFYDCVVYFCGWWNTEEILYGMNWYLMISDLEFLYIWCNRFNCPTAFAGSGSLIEIFWRIVRWCTKKIFTGEIIIQAYNRENITKSLQASYSFLTQWTTSTFNKLCFKAKFKSDDFFVCLVGTSLFLIHLMVTGDGYCINLYNNVF